jgi:two-component system chemotaxis sensor kinase CheA
MSDLDPEILVEFLIESRENLDQMERELVVLERDPAAATALNAIFRAIHTIKGTAGFLGLDALQRLTHVGETLLSRLRDRELVFTPALASLQLRLVDAVRAMLAYIEANGSESPEAYLELAADLAAASESDAAPAPALAPPQVAAPLPVAAPPPVTLAPPPPPPPASIIAPPPAPAAASPAPAEPARPVATDTTVRVDVGLLDQLVNLAGELVLARNRLTRYASTWLDPVHLASWQRLHQISSQLQEQVMKTRMQPIGTTWAKLPRTVRDLATQCGKQVRLELEGGETELDRTLLEAIRDPMTHALRNAIDHGIEPPTERLEACKEPEGVIRLRAYHDSGQVHIELSDDGAGIRPAKVKAKAIERGVISADAAERMSDAELIRLVFRPGFSTAETVTSVSGRGVGMDVVRSNIEKIGGQVDIASVAGEGTTLHIAIPLTLAILPALIVESGGERYAIPQAMLRELVRVDADHPIEHVHAAPVFRLRGRLLPLIDLARAVGAPASPAPQRIMVLSADGHEFGVLIDRYHDTEEIVVKPLGRHLRDVGQYGGATILGDGRVVLIVDCRAIARDVCRQLAAAPAAAVAQRHRRRHLDPRAGAAAPGSAEPLRGAPRDDRAHRQRGPDGGHPDRARRGGPGPRRLDPGDAAGRRARHRRRGRRRRAAADRGPGRRPAHRRRGRPDHRHRHHRAHAALVEPPLWRHRHGRRRRQGDRAARSARPDRGPRAPPAARHPMIRLCTFTVGGHQIGIDAGRIREIVVLRELTTVAGAPSHVRGLINLRGQIVACLDTAQVLAVDAVAAPRMAVVVDDADEVVSLAVDAVGDVLEFEQAQLDGVPSTVAADVAARLTGSYQRPGQLVMIVDLDRVLATTGAPS